MLKVILIILIAIIASFVYFITQDRYPNINLDEIKEVDFIIVGGGTAGCVLASRLSENSNFTVLLLEAGGADNILEVKIPAAFSKLYKSKVDWEYYSTPQENVNHRKMFLPRGKVMGGSSSMNAMIFNRGHPRDYDQWEALGNEGWSFEKLLPYFKKFERNANKKMDPKIHGFEGPVSINDLVEPHESIKLLLQSIKNAGYPIIDDLNAEDNFGAQIFQTFQKNGQRVSASDAYITSQVLSRKNLFIRTNAHVTKILVEKERTIGVEINHFGSMKTIIAKKEVILSAGTYNSPQLLMLSGIGPKNHLKQFGIPVVKDLPGVGQNLQDHVFFTVPYQVQNLSSLHTEETIGNILNWALRGKGPLTSNIGEFGAFVKSATANQLRQHPDLELIAGPVYFVNHGLEAPPKGLDFISLGAILLRPESIGYVKLRSKNPMDKPIINHEYLSSEMDIAMLVEGFKIVQNIFNQEPIKNYLVTNVSQNFETEDEIIEYIKNSLMSIYHPVGTCKMGVKDDKTAVVDEKLRLYGVKGLRVVDASVMPLIISGHTNAPVLAIAEKAADLIKEEYKE